MDVEIIRDIVVGVDYGFYMSYYVGGLFGMYGDVLMIDVVFDVVGEDDFIYVGCNGYWLGMGFGVYGGEGIIGELMVV